MFQASMDIPRDVPVVGVKTVSNRGFTPAELSEMCVEKLLHVSEAAPAPIREQAIAFKQRMRVVVESYLNQAVLSDRTTVYNALTEAGHPELAEHIRRL